MKYLDIYSLRVNRFFPKFFLPKYLERERRVQKIKQNKLFSKTIDKNDYRKKSIRPNIYLHTLKLDC